MKTAEKNMKTWTFTKHNSLNQPHKPFKTSLKVSE